MIVSRFKITIITQSRPPADRVNDQLQWIGSSLGLFGLRDKDKSCFRIFVELIKNLKSDSPITSDELAYRLSLSRGTVIHHINNMINAGIVVHEGNSYVLRVENLTSLIDEVERDLRHTLLDLKEIAKKIDKDLGLV